MSRYFALDIPFHRFVANTLIASCLGLVPLLFLYVQLTPGFATMLLDNRLALGRFLRQVVTNGLPVVFVINYISFFLFALITDHTRNITPPALVILIDVPVRIAVFFGLHALIYVFSADWYGSFGGDRMQALLVVGPTILNSAFFGNISGVYLYATLVSAVPLYTAAIEKILMEREGGAEMVRRWLSILPGTTGRVLIALLIFAIFAGLLTALAALIVWAQGA